MKRIAVGIGLFIITMFAMNMLSTTPSLALAAPPKTAAFSSSDTPDILVPPAEGKSVPQRLVNRTQTSWPWYITRAAGLVASVSLVILLLSGIGFMTGKSFRLLEPLTAWATHRALGIVFGVSVLIHIIPLLFDTYVPFTLAQLLLPFVSGYKPVSVAGLHLGSLWVALGVLALYGVIAIILSSLLWVDKKPRVWKFFHFLTYLVMIFVFFHALYLGTDLVSGPLKIVWIVFGSLVAIAIVYRLRRNVKAA